MLSCDKIFRSLNRYGAMAGLLLTLFVSSGEGVRLFPIPVNGDIKPETSDVAFHDKDSYCVGIQTARNLSSNQRTKHAGDLRIDAIGASPAYAGKEGRVAVSHIRASEFSPNHTFRSDPPITSHAGRAPPIA